MGGILSSKNKLVRDAVQKRFLERHPNYFKEHREKNRESYQAACRRHYENNKEEVNRRSLERYYNSGPVEKKRRWVYKLRTAYGLTEEKFWDMVKEQDGKCLICDQALDFSTPFKTPSVDHCHKTGKVRGILHRGCNTALGSFKDDPATLRRAADYLERTMA